MTLGRTSSGAVKIKTDGGTTRAVNCACCGGGCPCPLPNEIKGKKIAVTSVSWSSIVSFSTMDDCGVFSAQTADGYSIEVYRANLSPPPECMWDELWIVNAYNGQPLEIGSPCTELSSFYFAASPEGIHYIYDNYGCGSPSSYPDYDPDENTSAMHDACAIDAATCSNWTLTISEVLP